jgi:hypothetical protein
MHGHHGSLSELRAYPQVGGGARQLPDNMSFVYKEQLRREVHPYQSQSQWLSIADSQGMEAMAI